VNAPCTLCAIEAGTILTSSPCTSAAAVAAASSAASSATSSATEAAVAATVAAVAATTAAAAVATAAAAAALLALPAATAFVCHDFWSELVVRAELRCPGVPREWRILADFEGHPAPSGPGSAGTT